MRTSHPFPTRKWKANPSRTRVNALLQRLGLPEDRYYMILTKNELEIEALKKEIIACNALDSAKEGFSKVEQLEKLVNTDDNLEKQFILRSKALLGYLAGRYTKEEKLRMLIQAIGLTIPDFDLEIIGSHLYTVDEMKTSIKLPEYTRIWDKIKKPLIFTISC